MKLLVELWMKLPEWVRDYTLSSLNTFVATFLLAIAVQIGSEEPIQFTYAWVSGLLMIAFRSAVRATSKDLIPRLQKRLK